MEPTLKEFEVTGIRADIVAGTVRLTDAQARPRLHLLKQVGKKGSGVYEVLSPIQFKKGERFEYDGTFPKSMARDVMAPEAAEHGRREAAAAEQAKKDEQERLAKRKPKQSRK